MRKARCLIFNEWPGHSRITNIGSYDIRFLLATSERKKYRVGISPRIIAFTTQNRRKFSFILKTFFSSATNSFVMLTVFAGFPKQRPHFASLELTEGNISYNALSDKAEIRRYNVESLGTLVATFSSEEQTGWGSYTLQSSSFIEV